MRKEGTSIRSKMENQLMKTEQAIN